MEDLHSFEDCAVNTIIFLAFLKESKVILEKIPKENEFEQFPKLNKENMNKYYIDWKFYFLENSKDLPKKKKKIIFEWAKENHFNLNEKYNGNELNSLMNENLFPEYNKMITSLYEENSILTKLLNYHIINNLTHTIKFLSKIKDLYLKKKEEAIEANDNYAQLFDKSMISESDLKKKIDSLQQKIDSLQSKIQRLSSENNKLNSKNAYLTQELHGTVIDSQNYDSEMNSLKDQINNLNIKIETMKKESESRIKESVEKVKQESESRIEKVKQESESRIEKVKQESENKYNALTNFITELIDKFSLDLTQKIKDTSTEMKKKLKGL